jgi:hypothetical protein
MLGEMGTWILRAAACALTVTFTFAAAAQSLPAAPASPPSAADAATAKKHFESGLKLYGEGAYAEALIAFESSYRLGGRASALKNYAQCQRNLRRVVEAYEAYEQLLALHEAQLSPADKTAVRQAMDELSLLSIGLTVTVNEPGASIEIDGKPIGVSPLPKAKRVTVGEHRLRVSKTGFEPFEKPLEAKTGQDQKVDVTLGAEKLTGLLAVREQGGRTVHVFVDGEDKGPAPWEGEVKAGDHVVDVQGPGFASEKRPVKVATKEHIDLVLYAASTSGHLRITTLPASATIAVDGKTVGTGAWDSDVPPGKHTVEVSLAGYPPTVREITVTRGDTVVQEIPLVAAVPGAAVIDYRGVYARIGLSPALVLGGTPDNAGPLASSDEGIHLGLGGALRIGYAFDPIAVEVVGAFMFEHRNTEISYPQAGASGGQNTRAKYDVNGPNFFLGVGPRITSRHDTVRFTFGLAPGLSFRNYGVRREIDGSGSNCDPSSNPSCQNQSGTIDENFAGTGYTTLGFHADGGILIGNTPGAKFFLGLQAWFDFPPGDIIVGPDTRVPVNALRSKGAGFIVTDSASMFFGPVLGIQFGH